MSEDTFSYGYDENLEQLKRRVTHKINRDLEDISDLKNLPTAEEILEKEKPEN